MENIYIMKYGEKFIAEDYNSGGYGYETHDVCRAKQFDSPTKLMKWIGKDYPGGKIMKLDFVLTEVAMPDMEKAKIEEALAKLTNEEKRLLGL